MKSKSAAFSCSGCWFADIAGQFDEEAIQIGCDADRDDLFIDPVTGRTDFMDFPKYRSLDRFCSMYRGVEWAEDKGGQNNINLYDDEYMVNLARKENRLKFGIAVYDDENKDLSSMEESLRSILKATQKYQTSLVGALMVYQHKSRGINETLHMSNYFSQSGLWCRGCNLHEGDTYTQETDVFQQLTFADYFIKMKAGQTLDENIFLDIDKTINDEFEKVICFENNQVYAVMKSIIRSNYHSFSNYDQMICSLVDDAKNKRYYKLL